MNKDSKMNIKALTLLIFLLLPFSSYASLITSTTVTGTGTYYNSVNLLTDGTFPAEASFWRNNTNVFWNGITPSFTFDFGSVYQIDDVLLSVDNNDYMRIEWSLDSINWTDLFLISRYDGEITNGMDTMSTDINHSEYIGALDFNTIQTQFLRLSATGGDNSYSVGEFQVFGNSLSVPEPSSLAIFALGIMGLSLRTRKS